MIQDLRNITADKIPIGIVKSSHGLMGEVKVKEYTNYLSVFDKETDFLLYNRDKKRHLIVQIEQIKPAGHNLIIHFKGFKSIEDAEKIAGFEIYLPLDRLPEIGEDGYYFYQLLDCEVVDEQNLLIGRVIDVIETGSADVLSIAPNGVDIEDEPEKEIMIPVVQDFVIHIDKQKKRITVRLPVYHQRNGQT
ncbi:MAG TPA: ribosome maturation factor RimM [Thermotogota bacterium]|nr:ribosome maturation factor RimM [Thermotogota bacterium]HRW35131.1 ribosome maturation factor RimM [Thermotogota bacterium]